jgi:ADP-ribose pyrophosphatase YjhB (NUDIX family)
MEFAYCPVCAAALHTRQEAGRERLACPTGHWTHWDNPLPVLAALVEIDGKIMLARNAAWPEKMYALVTGFMERGESPLQGVLRELKEETNLDALETSLIGVYDFPRKNELIIAYHVKAAGELRLSEELVDYKMIAPEKLRPWRAGTGQAVADWMRGRGFLFEFADAPTEN